MVKIDLGDEVKCTVTGFKGLVVGLHHYLHGCTRVSVQPKVSKDGSHKDAVAFDEPQLKVLVRKKVKRGRTDIGGPEKYSDIRTY